MARSNYTPAERVLYAKDIIQYGEKEAYAMRHPDRAKQFCGPLAKSEIKRDLNLQKEIREQLEAQGLTLKYTASKLKELADAEKAIVVNNKIEYVKDNHTQLESLKTAYKLYGLLKEAPTIDARQITFSGSTENLSAVIDEMRKLNQELELCKDEGEVIDVK